jgi:hypothetical protein
MYDFTSGEFTKNLDGVDNLLNAHTLIAANYSIDEETKSDVLRAAVVFLHSAVEEAIRNLFLVCLPNCNIANVNRIPFVGHDATVRPKEILLGQLVPYSGRFVDNVIRDSIDKYVDTLNVNSSSHLTEKLQLCEINPTPTLQSYFPSLNELMQRRHQIVHQMDRPDELDAKKPVMPIEYTQVRTWRNSVEAFYYELASIVRSKPWANANKKKYRLTKGLVARPRHIKLETKRRG